MKPRKALQKIYAIANLKYDAYGEAIHPSEQLSMIQDILTRYDNSQDDEQHPTQ